MSQVISPPDIYFNGINFNSSFYVEDTGFTESQANQLYLRKTIQDTATALETFSSGLETTTLKATGTSNILNGLFVRDALTGATNTIYLNPTTPNYPNMSLQSPFNALAIYIESTSNTANILCQSSKTLNVGCSATDVTLNLGTGPRNTAVVHHYSDGDNAVAGSNVHLNNGSGNLSNTAIRNGINSIGAVNLATGSGSSTAISIGTNGATATANRIRIGSVTRQTYLDSDTIAMGALGLTGSGAISIATGTNTAGAQVSIGSTSLSAVNIKGVQTNFETTTLNLNTNGTGNTLIGTSGGSNSITINRPLTIGYAPSAITTSSQLGYTTTDAITLTGAIPNAVVTPIFTAIILPAGVWLITYSLRLRSSGTTTVASYYMWGEDSITVQTPTYAMNAENTAFITDTNGFSNTGTFVVTSTGTTTYNIGIYIAYSGSTIVIDFGLPDFGSVVRRTRIA